MGSIWVDSSRCMVVVMCLWLVVGMVLGKFLIGF